MYTYSKDGILIRTMTVSDVSPYVARFDFKDLNHRKRMILQSKKVLKNLGEDPIDTYLAVLEKGVLIGAIVAKGFKDDVTDATVEVDVPKASIEEIRKIKKVFVEFAKETYIYDNIYFLNPNRTIGKKIAIAGTGCSEKTPK